MNLNKVQLAGNLTRNPELGYTPKGTAVTRFGMAVNRKWKTESGEQKEDVTFIDVDAFGKTAEMVAQYFKKGKPIYLDGRLKLEQWDDKTTGQKRSKLGVVLESFQFIGKNEDGQRSTPARATQPAGTNALPADDDSNSVPF